MSHIAHPHSFGERNIRTALLAALVLLLATAAVVVVIALSDDSSSGTDVSAGQSQPALRSGGGPEESATAHTVGPRVGGAGFSSGPNEASTAAAVGSGAPSVSATGPNEASTAAALGGHH
jgi:hypothetical protein